MARNVSEMSLKAAVISGLIGEGPSPTLTLAVGVGFRSSQAVGLRPQFLPRVPLRGSAYNMAAGFHQFEQVREREGDRSQSLLVTSSWK